MSDTDPQPRHGTDGWLRSPRDEGAAVGGDPGLPEGDLQAPGGRRPRHDHGGRARQGVSPASASAMVKKLAALGLLEHEPYRGARLTEAGERVAVEVIRHHRLIELYLAETLGLDVDAVHDEADRLEHVISEELEERIDRALGFPTHDPHGDPIPDADLSGRPREGLAATRRPARERPCATESRAGSHGRVLESLSWRGSSTSGKSPFAFLFTRSKKEEIVAEYVIREHHRGRSLDRDPRGPYVTNRCSPEQVRRLLDRPDIVHAVGEDTRRQRPAALRALGRRRARARARRRARRRRDPTPRSRST